MSNQLKQKSTPEQQIKALKGALIFMTVLTVFLAGMMGWNAYKIKELASGGWNDGWDACANECNSKLDSMAQTCNQMVVGEQIVIDYASDGNMQVPI